MMLLRSRAPAGAAAVASSHPRVPASVSRHTQRRHWAQHAMDGQWATEKIPTNGSLPPPPQRLTSSNGSGAASTHTNNGSGAASTHSTNGTGSASATAPPPSPQQLNGNQAPPKRKRKAVTRRFSREDYDLLPHRIVLIRHAESMGNVEKDTYCTNPDHKVVLTDNGRRQALEAGQQLCDTLSQVHGEDDFSVFFMTSPYSRTIETTDMLLEAFTEDQVLGVRSAVQLREQDFGNFQDPQRINQDMNDRIKFGRFWFRFPNGESGADVYDRITIFEDHLTRDMLMGRFNDTSLVLVTHGLTLRLFLMRWFHWSVEEMLRIFNPGNCVPVTLEKLPWEVVHELQNNRYVGVKQCFAITPTSIVQLRGCTRGMASYLPRNLKDRSAKASWKAMKEPKVEETPEQLCEVSGNWLYGYYCSVPEPTMQHSSWANTGEGDMALQSEDEAACWLDEMSKRSGESVNESVSPREVRFWEADQKCIDN